MAARKNTKKQQQEEQEPKRIRSTTSLGKRRSIRSNKSSKSIKSERGHHNDQHEHDDHSHHHHRHKHHKSSEEPHRSNASSSSNGKGNSTLSDPRASDYGSQATPLRMPVSGSSAPVKVAILGASGGIGQPLSLLLMLHSEYVQHLALYDLCHVHGVGADLSHIDRQCKLTTHQGPEELPEAVRGAKVIIITAGLAQKPGMTRDDLFGSNAKIMFNLAKVCAQVAPEAILAIVSNPVNSLVPLVCEIYAKILGPKSAPPPPLTSKSIGSHSPISEGAESTASRRSSPEALQRQQADSDSAAATAAANNSAQKSEGRQSGGFHESFRRILGVTTLDVVRASTLTARSSFFKAEPNGLFKDPAKVTVPVIGGHAGKTILPILSQATPKLDKKRLTEDKVHTLTLIESVQQAGIEVLNAKQGKGSATLSMAYAASRFTISLLRALQGEQNIIECAYVRQRTPVVPNLDYFATPILLGQEGYMKSMGIGKLMPFEQTLVDEAAKELRTSVAKGEDFAKEHLMADK